MFQRIVGPIRKHPTIYLHEMSTVEEQIIKVKNWSHHHVRPSGPDYSSFPVSEVLFNIK